MHSNKNIFILLEFYLGKLYNLCICDKVQHCPPNGSCGFFRYILLMTSEQNSLIRPNGNRTNDVILRLFIPHQALYTSTSLKFIKAHLYLRYFCTFRSTWQVSKVLSIFYINGRMLH